MAQLVKKKNLQSNGSLSSAWATHKSFDSRLNKMNSKTDGLMAKTDDSQTNEIMKF